MINLTPVMIDKLFRGASLLACGGGLKFEEQKKIKLRQIARLVQAAELNSTDWCATVSEVGAAGAPIMTKSALPTAIKMLERKTGKKIKALIPPEIGQERIVLEAALSTNLPIVDSDLAGCRAVPRLSDMALALKGVDFTVSPAVILKQSGKVVFISQQPSLTDDERNIRSMVPDDEVITLVGAMVKASTIKKHLDYQSFSVAMKIGAKIKAGQSLNNSLPTEILFSPTNTVVQKINNLTSKGFDSKIVTIKIAGQTAQLAIENEFMKLTLKTGRFSFPQLIMIFDPLLKRGVHSSELKEGSSYQLMVADSFAFWKGKR